MYSCPACGRSDVAELSRCTCGADLAILQSLDAVADAWFNRALAALAKGEPGKALEWVSACYAARPNDAAARLTQAMVWAQLGHFLQARAALDQAANLDSSLPGLAGFARALQDAFRPAAPDAPRPGAKPKAAAKRLSKAAKARSKKLVRAAGTRQRRAGRNKKR